MPAKSQKQRAYLYAHFGPQWVKAHHFDNTGKLPLYANKQHHVPSPGQQRSSNGR